ncbi:MAG: hypothetical protein HY305_03150 [Sphingobacteriales bacterium]|nr:hypothetical protein [Sphingobacteriales bacterium]
MSSLAGSFLKYPIYNNPDRTIPTVPDNTGLLVDLTAMLNFKLISDKYFLSPFMTVGVGGSKYGSNYGAFLPAGLGLQMNFKDKVYLLFTSQYRVPLTSLETTSYHLSHSIGFYSSIGKKNPVVAKPISLMLLLENPKDQDGDEVMDAEDKCPDVAGLVSLHGCPDQDGDNIADAEDKCPDVAGFTRYGGCPIPDNDRIIPFVQLENKSGDQDGDGIGTG